MNRTLLLGGAVILVAAGLLVGITVDLDTLSLRHLKSHDYKQVFAVVVVTAVVLLVLAGKFSGGGPEPPKFS